MINKKDKILHIRLTEREMEAIDRIVAKTDFCKSDIGRLAILRLIKLSDDDE